MTNAPNIHSMQGVPVNFAPGKLKSGAGQQVCE